MSIYFSFPFIVWVFTVQDSSFLFCFSFFCVPVFFSDKLVTSQPEQSQAIYSLFLLAMKNFSTIATQYIYVLFFLHCCCCTMFVLVLVQAADPSSSEAPMHKAEQQALYSAVQAFVGSWWNGSDLYPDPCGWTPIQVLISQ